MKEQEQWLRDLTELHLPRYDELSSIPLYVDQVLEFVNVNLSTLYRFDDTVITRGMINNYVKHKVMPAPNKKRYQEEHLAYIITITLLKSIFSIQSISKGIEVVLETYDIDVAYNLFIESIEISLRMLVDEVYEIKTDIHKNEEIYKPLKAISIAFSAKILSDFTFNEYISREEI